MCTPLNVPRSEFDLIGAFHGDEGGVSLAAAATTAATAAPRLPGRPLHSPQVRTRKARHQAASGWLFITPPPLLASRPLPPLSPPLRSRRRHRRQVGSFQSFHSLVMASRIDTAARLRLEPHATVGWPRSDSATGKSAPQPPLCLSLWHPLSLPSLSNAAVSRGNFSTRENRRMPWSERGEGRRMTLLLLLH